MWLSSKLRKIKPLWAQACSGFYFLPMRRTPVAGILEYIIFLLYLPFFTIWVSATKQASDTHKLFTAWVSATKQASDTHKLFSVWVSATKQASHTHKLFSVWVSATKQASHTHKLFTLRRKKGTEKLDPISCAHAEAEEGYRRNLSGLRQPYVTSHAPNS